MSNFLKGLDISRMQDFVRLTTEFKNLLVYATGTFDASLWTYLLRVSGVLLASSRPAWPSPSRSLPAVPPGGANNIQRICEAVGSSSCR